MHRWFWKYHFGDKRAEGESEKEADSYSPKSLYSSSTGRIVLLYTTWWLVCSRLRFVLVTFGSKCGSCSSSTLLTTSLTTRSGSGRITKSDPMFPSYIQRRLLHFCICVNILLRVSLSSEIKDWNIFFSRPQRKLRILIFNNTHRFGKKLLILTSRRCKESTNFDISSVSNCIIIIYSKVYIWTNMSKLAMQSSIFLNNFSCGKIHVQKLFNLS